MKTLIVLYAGNSCLYQFDSVFDGKNAFEKTLFWADNICTDKDIVVLCGRDNLESVQENIKKSAVSACAVCLEKLTQGILFEQLALLAAKEEYEMVLYSYACVPFINHNLCRQLMDVHKKYLAEYSFADGYAAGSACEILDRGLCSILWELCKTKDSSFNEASVTKETVFKLLQTDINSFEIESVISNIDWRLYRFDFACDSYSGLMACKNLYEISKDLTDIQEITKAASTCVDVLKTVPAFYNIQIEKKASDKNPYSPYTQLEEKVSRSMPLEQFTGLVKKISEFSRQAVVGLSLWGEPLLHEQFFDFAKEVLRYPGLSLLIETNGVSLDDAKLKQLEELSRQISAPPALGYEKIMWIVSVDAVTQETYSKIHPGKQLQDALDFITVIKKYFNEGIYPQFLRMNVNEDELESFYRTYKESPLTGGNFVIQKYDHFCRRLRDEKPADLSPLERMPCWHLLRDMNILADGSVVQCRDCLFDNVIGNVFENDLEQIWHKNDDAVMEHIEGRYSGCCRECDEYYTFNF